MFLKITVLLALTITPLIGHSDEILLDDFRIHLLLEKSGSLSPDITEIDNFISFNRQPFGKGIDSSERFYDFLILVKFKADEESYVSASVAELKVSKLYDGEVLLSTDFRKVYVGPEKETYKPIWVAGHGCYPLVVTVVGSNISISKELHFDCGE